MIVDIKAIHNISRPGEEPKDGDIVEIECVGGFVKQVDPKTRKAAEAHQRFRLSDNGVTLTLLRGELDGAILQGVHPGDPRAFGAGQTGKTITVRHQGARETTRRASRKERQPRS